MDESRCSDRPPFLDILPELPSCPPPGVPAVSAPDPQHPRAPPSLRTGARTALSAAFPSRRKAPSGALRSRPPPDRVAARLRQRGRRGSEAGGRGWGGGGRGGFWKVRLSGEMGRLPPRQTSVPRQIEFHRYDLCQYPCER